MLLENYKNFMDKISEGSSNFKELLNTKATLSELKEKYKKYDVSRYNKKN